MLDPLLSIDEVRTVLGGKSRRSIYRWIDEGIFPKPIKFAPNSVGWPESTIREFIEKKKEEAVQLT